MKVKLRLIAAVCCVHFLISGCVEERSSLREGPPPPSLESPNAAPLAADPNQEGRRTYRIKPDDILVIKIYPGDEFKQALELEVDAEGDINMPLLNRVHVGGMTPVEAERQIAQRLDESFIVNPSVALRVKEYHIRTVVVLGEVKRPGTYEFPPSGKLTLMKAIALAGGFTNIAAMDRVHLIRKRSRTQEAFRVNAEDIINGKAEDVPVEPDDLITIPETFF